MRQEFAHFNRYLWSEHDLLIVTGEAEVLEAQRLAYHQRHGIELPTADVSVALARLMAGAGLALAASTKPDSWGWTLTLDDSPDGFFAAAEPEGMICASVRHADRKKVAMAVQRQEPGGALRQSNYRPVAADPLSAVEGYFTHSEQIATRLASAADGRSVLVQALPGANLVPVAHLADVDVVEQVWRMVADKGLTLMHEMVLFYECRCSDERILDMLVSLPADQRREVWGEQTSLDIACPRCGRVYVVNRS